MIALSVLDQVRFFRGSTASETISESIALALEVERLGYQRFWIAEHHSMGHFACASPEILAAVIAAHTARIRVGSGGVMLSNYSPFKVAETFRLLHTLFPGRIDLGIGRGAGANPPALDALNPSHNAGETDHYSQQVQDLVGFVQNNLPETHPYYGAWTMPDGPGSPEVWILGSGESSMEIAADQGLPFCFAQFIHSKARPHIIAAYRQHFRPSYSLPAPRASLAVRVLCAENAEQAQQLARSFWLVCMREYKGPYFLHATESVARAPSMTEALAYTYTELE
jgi:luciferase family oxidoreductase group 1